MGGRYLRTPILEAVCEFQFLSDAWDWTIPGLLYREIASEFSLKREKGGIQLEPAAEGLMKAAPVRRLHFVRPDETAFVDVGENVLAVHHLAPYPGWHKFKPAVESTLERYVGIAKPTGLKRIGLRYINRLEFSEAQVPLPSYVTFQPLIPPGLPTEMKAMFCRVELLYPKDNGLLLMSLGSVEGGVVLDLDFVTLDPAQIALRDTMSWVETAHRNLGSAFEASIGDAARDLFGRRDASEVQK